MRMKYSHGGVSREMMCPHRDEVSPSASHPSATTGIPVTCGLHHPLEDDDNLEIVLLQLVP